MKSPPRMLDRLIDGSRMSFASRLRVEPQRASDRLSRVWLFATMGATTRTFFAIEIPETSGSSLRGCSDRLVAELPGCRWTTSTPFHMTLAFLGDVPDVD